MKKVGVVIASLIILFISFFFDKVLLNFFIKIEHQSIIYLMIFFTILIYLLILIFTFLLFKLKEKAKFPAIGFILTLAVNEIFKFLILRPRPESILVLGHSYSFPSLHTAMAFFLLPFLNKHFKKLRYLWFILVILIFISRLYLRAHYLSDVIAGAIIGYFIALVFIKKWRLK